jgi:hypothetical protein
VDRDERLRHVAGVDRDPVPFLYAEVPKGLGKARGRVREAPVGPRLGEPVLALVVECDALGRPPVEAVDAHVERGAGVVREVAECTDEAPRGLAVPGQLARDFHPVRLGRQRP